MSTLSAREQRGQEMALRLRITQNASGTYEVPSETSNKKYVVDPDEKLPGCSCPDFELNQRPCKHVFAVRAFLRNQQSAAPTASQEPGRVKAKKPLYRQVWPAYNAAQTSEKHRFQELLYEMCRGIQEPERDRPKGGRPPLRLADVVFAVE